MDTLKGQESILDMLLSYNLDTFPKTLLLEGSEGSGKHEIIKIVAKKLNLKCLDITQNLDFDSINSYYLRVEPHLYIIDADKIAVKYQNAILKFLEEPLKNSFIILFTVNKYNIIETIRNRCRVVTLNKYSKQTLREIFKDINDSIISIADTPGEVIKLNNCNLDSEYGFIKKIIEKIAIANFSNIFNITNHIAFDNEINKLSVNLFFKLIKKCILDDIILGSDKYLMYSLTENYCNKLRTPNIDKKYLIENYLINLWKIAR